MKLGAMAKRENNRFSLPLKGYFEEEEEEEEEEEDEEIESFDLWPRNSGVQLADYVYLSR